jgi:hypothetical protein
MKHYWCFLCVRFSNPRLVHVGSRNEVLRADGYMRRLGVTVKSGTDLRKLIRTSVKDGRISWRKSELERIRRHDLGVNLPNGVWYSGGPLYFA